MFGLEISKGWREWWISFYNFETERLGERERERERERKMALFQGKNIQWRLVTV